MKTKSKVILGVINHMYFQGGMTKRVKIKPFYLELVRMIDGLAEVVQ